METKKMSLANITGKLSRAEMKNIMAGSGSDGCLVQCPSGPRIQTCSGGACGQFINGNVMCGGKWYPICSY